MPDLQPLLAPRLPLEGFLAAGRHGEGNGVVLRERTGLAVRSVQARRGRAAELAGLVRDRFGLDLPQGPKRAASGGIAFLGVGPGKWLALHEEGLGLRLAETLAGLASAVDQSDAYAVVRVTGPHAREALQRALPIDLHPRAFGPGDVAVTSMAHIGVTLWLLDPAPTFELAAPRSYAGDFARTLLASTAAFGAEVLPPLG